MSRTRMDGGHVLRFQEGCHLWLVLRAEEHHRGTLWETAGGPMSMAGATRAVAGQARVGPVYTPPERRGRGFGGAVTAAVSQAAKDAGVGEVLLYTDLANPTSNALYQRLGYEPVSDSVQLLFLPALIAEGPNSTVIGR